MSHINIHLCRGIYSYIATGGVNSGKWGLSQKIYTLAIALNLLMHCKRRRKMGPRFIVVPGKRGGARGMRAAWSRLG